MRIGIIRSRLQHRHNGIAGHAFAGFVVVRWPAETARTVFPFFASLLVVQADFAFDGHAGDGPRTLRAFARLDLVGRHLAAVGRKRGQSRLARGLARLVQSPSSFNSAANDLMLEGPQGVKSDNGHNSTPAPRHCQ